MTRWIKTMVCAVGAVVLIGCGSSVGNDGQTVGGPCSSNADCDQQCLTGGDFPQGTCAVSCDTDADCPDGSYCIDKQGGVCLLGCQLPSDCRGGYSCEGQTNHGHGGDSLVCVKD